MSELDTIAAIATPPGTGGVGIIRLSGPAAFNIAERLSHSIPRPGTIQFRQFFDGLDRTIDNGILLYFKAPHSFTGEDVIEIQGHGGQVLQEMLLGRVCELGARLATAGEFSQRAFLNDKFDLAQAEAIADLIAADSEDAARAAMRSLQGEFSAEIHALVEQLIELRMYVEAALDFPEEEIDFLADVAVAGKLEAVASRVGSVFESARQGCLLKEGMTVVIAGKPNAGKSSLLNQLSGSDTAIVTDIPGTTRDVLREHIQIDGLPLHIIDTAGLRESDDAVEKEGVRRAWKEIKKSDRLLFVVDSQTAEDIPPDIQRQIDKETGLTVVFNKTDLSREQNRIVEKKSRTDIYLSAYTGQGVDLLKQHLKKSMGYHQPGEGQFIARRRHLTAIQQASHHLSEAGSRLKSNMGELLAEELRLAQQQLSTITGEFTSDDLLGVIFAGFCIGK